MRRLLLDDGMDPFGDGAIRVRHLGDLRQHVGLAVRLGAALGGLLLLLGVLHHRGPFFVRPDLGRPGGGAPARRLRVFHDRPHPCGLFGLDSC
jgi:hypothetical protein